MRKKDPLHLVIVAIIPILTPIMQNQMEKKMENEMETLGPFKGVIMDNKEYIKVLLYLCHTTITGWGALLTYKFCVSRRQRGVDGRMVSTIGEFARNPGKGPWCSPLLHGIQT